jgi:hypothetical protein
MRNSNRILALGGSFTFPFSSRFGRLGSRSVEAFSQKEKKLLRQQAIDDSSEGLIVRDNRNDQRQG